MQQYPFSKFCYLSLLSAKKMIKPTSDETNDAAEKHKLISSETQHVKISMTQNADYLTFEHIFAGRTTVSNFESNEVENLFKSLIFEWNAMDLNVFYDYEMLMMSMNGNVGTYSILDKNSKIIKLTGRSLIEHLMDIMSDKTKSIYHHTCLLFIVHLLHFDLLGRASSNAAELVTDQGKFSNRFLDIRENHQEALKFAFIIYDIAELLSSNLYDEKDLILKDIQAGNLSNFDFKDKLKKLMTDKKKLIGKYHTIEMESWLRCCYLVGEANKSKNPAGLIKSIKCVCSSQMRERLKCNLDQPHHKRIALIDDIFNRAGKFELIIPQAQIINIKEAINNIQEILDSKMVEKQIDILVEAELKKLDDVTRRTVVFGRNAGREISLFEQVLSTKRSAEIIEFIWNDFNLNESPELLNHVRF